MGFSIRELTVVLLERTIAAPFLTVGDQIVNLTVHMQRKATHSVYFQLRVFLIRYRFDHLKKTLCFLATWLRVRKMTLGTFFRNFSKVSPGAAQHVS